MSKRSPIITAGIALLVALTLSVSVAQPAFAHATKSARPAFSGKSDPWTAVTYLNQFVPSLYPAQTNGANDEWWSSGYANTTDVDESNWAIVITNGQVSPANFQISTAGYIVDSNGIYYQMPNNYPTCFVEYGDAYSCGDTHYHGAWTYYNTGNATWETAGTIYTNDIYLHRYNRYDSWPLDTF